MTVDLAIRTWGDGSRRFLLIHGIHSNSEGWWRLGPDLAGSGYHVTAVDLRSHGESPTATGHSFADFAGDVLAVGAGWDVVLGHSLGGAIAVTAATRRPGWTRRIVLEDPALLIPDLDEARTWLLDPFREGGNDLATMMVDHPDWHPEDTRLKVKAVDQATPQMVEATVADNDPWNLLDEITSLTVPTHIIGGDPANGGIVPVSLGEWFDSSFDHLTYEMLPGAGHSMHRENEGYQRFLAAVMAASEGRT